MIPIPIWDFTIPFLDQVSEYFSKVRENLELRAKGKKRKRALRDIERYLPLTRRLVDEQNPRESYRALKVVLELKQEAKQNLFQEDLELMCDVADLCYIRGNFRRAERLYKELLRKNFQGGRRGDVEMKYWISKGLYGEAGREYVKKRFGSE